MNDIQKQQLWQTVCAQLPDTYKKIIVNQSDLTEATMLAEQHWISPELLHAKGPRGAAIYEQGGMSIMVNEEDHLRLQTILPDLSLDKALHFCIETEQLLGEKISYAFNVKYGYLTACPTNLGAGMRASVMLHLPALTKSGQMGRIIAEVAQIGHLVRGFYGEGSDALGGYYQISNRNSLGITSSEIVKRLQDTVWNILDKENAVRKALRNDNPGAFDDQVWRSYGVLKNARLMSYEEALGHFSLLRMGIIEGVLPEITTKTIDMLSMNIGPHTLSYKAGRQLDAVERDRFRAEIIRKEI